MDMDEIRAYYSRDDVQDAIFKSAKDREAVGIFYNGVFGTRPDILEYPRDIAQMADMDVVSFHGSVERWENPMRLVAGMPREELDNLRAGWDLVLDPDAVVFEHAKIATRLFAEALKKHGIKNIFCKSTGGRGFHIAVAFESFSDTINNKPTEKQFPELPRIITEYLKWYVRDELETEILKIEPDLEELAKKVGKPLKEILTRDGIDVYKIVTEIGLCSSRHLFRLPYAVNEKTSLVSVPIKVSDIGRFRKEDAKIEKVKIKERFLTSLEKINEHDANGLLIGALDWWDMRKEEIEEPKKPARPPFLKPVPKKYFPDCIKLILKGLPDGRKRSVFVLITFLRNMNWSMDDVEKVLMEWNRRNTPPLPQTYLRYQLRWFSRQEWNMLPPNCNNEKFYKEMGVYCSDEVHQKVKNPVDCVYKKFGKKGEKK